MTVDEKREIVSLYCCKTECNECVLKNRNWEHEFIGRFTCIKMGVATEAELDIALNLIAEESVHCVEPEDCVEPAAEDAELVIKIKSSRKINCLHVEFAEEE